MHERVCLRRCECESACICLGRFVSNSPSSFSSSFDLTKYMLSASLCFGSGSYNRSSHSIRTLSYVCIEVVRTHSHSSFNSQLARNGRFCSVLAIVVARNTRDLETNGSSSQSISTNSIGLLSLLMKQRSRCVLFQIHLFSFICQGLCQVRLGSVSAVILLVIVEMFQSYTHDHASSLTNMGQFSPEQP